jgi:hypothetical protein
MIKELFNIKSRRVIKAATLRNLLPSAAPHFAASPCAPQGHKIIAGGNAPGTIARKPTDPEGVA